MEVQNEDTDRGTFASAESDAFLDAEALKVLEEKRHLSGANLRGLKAGKGFNIIDQLNDLKKKTSSEFLSDWKPKLQPRKKEIKRIVAQRMVEKEAKAAAASVEARQRAEAKAAEAKAKADERDRSIHREYEKLLKYKGMSPKKAPQVGITHPELNEDLQLNVSGIERKKVYEHIVNRYGIGEFSAMLKRRSIFQLRDARIVYAGMIQSLGGIKAILNNKKQSVSINSLQNLEMSPTKTEKSYTGTLIFLSPTTHTSDGIFNLRFTYVLPGTGQHETIESPIIFHDGHYLGLDPTTSFKFTESFAASPSFNSYSSLGENKEPDTIGAATRSLPGWDNIVPIWVPSCDFTCEYEMVEEPIDLTGKEPAFCIPFQAIPFISQQSAHRAIRKSYSEHVKAKLRNRAATLTVCGGMSALSVASFNDNKQVIRYLLDSGSDTNNCSEFNNATSLHEAVIGGNVQVIEMLLTSGANQTIKDSAGQTPLHVACRIGNVFAVKALCRGSLAKKAAQMVDRLGYKPNEVCRSSYCRSVLEKIMRDSHLVVRPPRESINTPGVI